MFKAVILVFVNIPFGINFYEITRKPFKSHTYTYFEQSLSKFNLQKSKEIPFDLDF